MAKKTKSAMQWKTVRGVSLDRMARTCEEWTGRGWNVFTVLGPLSDGFAIVLSRMLTL